jgi:hypothetical protein
MHCVRYDNLPFYQRYLKFASKICAKKDMRNILNYQQRTIFTSVGPHGTNESNII